MKYTGYYTFYLLLTLLPANLTGQMTSVYVTRGNNAAAMTYFLPETKKPDELLNPYLYKGWQPGRALFNDSLVWEGLFRYDIHAREMELVIGKDSLRISDPHKVNLVEFGQHHFIYSYFIYFVGNQQYLGNDYFEVLSDNGDTKFLLRRYIKVDVEEKSNSKMMLGLKNEESVSAKIIKEYYIRKNDDSAAMKVKKSRKSILSHLEPYQAELSNFAKTNDLSFTQPEEIARIINHYNSLNENQ